MILRERVWVIVACTILAFVAAVAYVAVAPKKYQAMRCWQRCRSCIRPATPPKTC